MYAVIRSGGKQYRVAPGDVIRVENIGDGNGQVEFADVLAVSGGDGQIGRPQSEARVTGAVVEQGRGRRSWSSTTSARSSTRSCADIARVTPRSASPRLLSTARVSPRLSFPRRKRRSRRKRRQPKQKSRRDAGQAKAEAKSAKRLRRRRSQRPRSRLRKKTARQEKEVVTRNSTG